MRGLNSSFNHILMDHFSPLSLYSSNGEESVRSNQFEMNKRRAANPDDVDILVRHLLAPFKEILCEFNELSVIPLAESNCSVPEPPTLQSTPPIEPFPKCPQCSSTASNVCALSTTVQCSAELPRLLRAAHPDGFCSPSPACSPSAESTAQLLSSRGSRVPHESIISVGVPRPAQSEPLLSPSPITYLRPTDHPPVVVSEPPLLNHVEQTHSLSLQLSPAVRAFGALCPKQTSTLRLEPHPSKAHPELWMDQLLYRAMKTPMQCAKQRARTRRAPRTSRSASWKTCLVTSLQQPLALSCAISKCSP